MRMINSYKVFKKFTHAMTEFITIPSCEEMKGVTESRDCFDEQRSFFFNEN